jgi:hypothetical protein
MKIHTMAMQITEKNWSVAAAILGAQVTDRPPSETYGHYVVINTFAAPGRIYRSNRVARYGGVRNDNGLSLDNWLFDANDFNVMFDYDKRTKNLEHFFEVTQINSYPVKIHPDQELDNAIQTLNEVWHKED